MKIQNNLSRETRAITRSIGSPHTPAPNGGLRAYGIQIDFVEGPSDLKHSVIPIAIGTVTKLNIVYTTPYVNEDL